MLNNLQNKIASELGFTTYQMGLLQAKAYRILRARTAMALKPYKLSTIEWALLGTLSESKPGMHFREIAKALGVEASFVTELLDKLIGRGLISTSLSSKDRRFKKARVTKLGHKLVSEIEKRLRTEMKPLLKSASIKNLIAYRAVLEAIIKNDESLPPN